MFIELHQTKDGLPIRVNSSHIQCFAKWSEECSFIYFDSDHWLEVTESYEEIIFVSGFDPRKHKGCVVKMESTPSDMKSYLIPRDGGDAE